MKKRAVRSGYGDLFADWELAVTKGLVGKFWTTNCRLRAVCEKEDLLQECLIHWLKVRDCYSKDRGASRKTFMAKVVEMRLLELLRAENTHLRRINTEARLFSTPVGGDPDTGHTVEDEADEVGTEQMDVSEFEVATVQQILADALEALTPRQRVIAELLAQGIEKAEIARKVGKHRDTVYEDIKRIQKLFEDKGLKRFLG